MFFRLCRYVQVSSDNFRCSRASATINLEFRSMRNAEMSIHLDLPPELESQLSTEALRLNLLLSEYILRVLSIGQVLSNPPKTGAELVAYWQSEKVINSRPDITDSQVYARNLRHQAQTRTRT
jgi:hypothetical protein